MSWAEKNIGDLGKIVTGKTPPTANRDFYDGEFQFVTPTDLDWQSYIVRSTHSSVTKLAKENLRNQFIPAGATTFTCIGNTIGKCGLTSEVCLTNQQINTIVPNAEHEPKFVYYLMIHNCDRIRSVGLGGGAAQPIINKSTFSAFKVRVPDLRTQTRIASILSGYDDLIENNRRRVGLLEQAARLLYREWFVHFRFPGHETAKIVNGLPEGWKLTRIKEAYNGLYDGPHATPKPSEEGPIFLGIKNIREGGGVDLSDIRHVSEDEYPKWTRRVTPEKGDIVFSYEATLHRYALIPAGLRCCLGRRMALIRPKEEYRYYLYLQMFSERWREVISARTLVGATVDRIPIKKFPDFPILLPPGDLTASFSALVEPNFLMIETLTEQNKKLTRARDLLLPRLMDGRITD